ncbi:N-acetylgalactosamine kinase [Thrips palmi]|uniref:N-acetylgalactosamine kinase n=1 Tax=Thrips palmi TaxID=161013 RepID=A0A6P9AA77_THRPL|nr:N-acetylgalactosamine kinase [Thrips palmi]
MGSLNIPTVHSIESFKNEPLLNSVLEKFKNTYGSTPNFVVRVPGRVNLIGEHIDYCGYSVLPMALDQHILIAVSPTGDTSLNLVNVNSKYSTFNGNIKNLNVDDPSLGVLWHNYVLCGIRGVAETYGTKGIVGMNLCVAGNVLPNSGLSSSSALVCAAALATSHANQISLSKEELASLCAKSERYIGTEGGGMDQAIAFLAKPGCAKHISFKPLRSADVKIPAGLAILVAHSFAELNKAAGDQFNHRVAECRLASVILAQKSGLTTWKNLLVLADVQKELNVSLSDMVLRTSELLPKDTYSKEEICEILQISSDEVDQCFLPENTRNTKLFKLRQRATHVFEEALRVSKFQELCTIGSSQKELGELMNQSHDSLRDLYECSHPKLDALVEAARKNGALGARLTGAGWGGCMVALTTAEHADILIASLKETFYTSLPASEKLTGYVFHSQPGNGAFILE